MYKHKFKFSFFLLVLMAGLIGSSIFYASQKLAERPETALAAPGDINWSIYPGSITAGSSISAPSCAIYSSDPTACVVVGAPSYIADNNTSTSYGVQAWGGSMSYTDTITFPTATRINQVDFIHTYFGSGYGGGVFTDAWTISVFSSGSWVVALTSSTSANVTSAQYTSVIATGWNNVTAVKVVASCTLGGSWASSCGHRTDELKAWGPAPSAYVDCGLRIFDGTAKVTPACEPLGTLTSPLRIAKNGNTYGVALVDPSDPNALKARIQTRTGTKALRKISGSTFVCGDTLTYNGDAYATVQMSAAYGGKCWFKENLRTTQKPDGVTNIISACNPSGCVSPWGRLYDWNTMMNGSPAATGCGAKIQGICPAGWHIPSDYLSCTGDDFSSLGADGGALKKTGTAEWSAPNTGATNASNWTAYPAGFYWDGTGGFYFRGSNGLFWSSITPEADGNTANPTYGWGRRLDFNSATFTRNYYFRRITGLSVRCVKD